MLSDICNVTVIFVGSQASPNPHFDDKVLKGT